MSDQLIVILEKSKNKSIDFSKYKSYFLNTYLKVNNEEIKLILKDYIEESLVDVKVYYNSKTETFNNIGIIDLDDYRVIDLDDDNYTMTNKGIDKSIELNLSN